MNRVNERSKTRDSIYKLPSIYVWRSFKKHWPRNSRIERWEKLAKLEITEEGRDTEIGLKCRRNNMKIFILSKRKRRALPNGKLKKNRKSLFSSISIFPLSRHHILHWCPEYCVACCCWYFRYAVVYQFAVLFIGGINFADIQHF